jgi:hypothetical protein
VATLAYRSPNGSVSQTTQLNEAMEMMGTSSSLGMETFAISVACEYEVQNGKPVANTNKYKFSIKCHNFFHVKKTDYHGRPQTTAVGFPLSEELANEAEVLSRPAVMSNVLGGTESLFGGDGWRQQGGPRERADDQLHDHGLALDHGDGRQRVVLHSRPWTPSRCTVGFGGGVVRRKLQELELECIYTDTRISSFTPVVMVSFWTVIWHVISLGCAVMSPFVAVRMSAISILIGALC